MKSYGTVFAVFSILFFLVLSSFTASAQQGKEVRIGVIDFQKIIVESMAGKKARADFSRDVESKKKILAGREESIKFMNDELKKEAQGLPASVRKEKEEKLAKEVKEIRRLKDDLEDDLKRKEAELGNKLIKEILAVAKKIGETEKYTLLIEKGPSVVYVPDQVDITEHVMKKLDAGK